MPVLPGVGDPNRLAVLDDVGEDADLRIRVVVLPVNVAWIRPKRCEKSRRSFAPMRCAGNRSTPWRPNARRIFAKSASLTDAERSTPRTVAPRICPLGSTAIAVPLVAIRFGPLNSTRTPPP